MRTSIVLATYNGAAFLQEQLQSYVEQERSPDELVVCDDASTDRTLEIVQAFAATAPFAVRVFASEVRLGLTRNFERALSLACGDLLFLSDQDDKWLPSKIAEVAAHLESHPTTDVIINDAYYGDATLRSGTETILQRVLRTGAPKRAHIAGACTALTAGFRDFLVPFPASGVPQYDVYIHRWVNAVGTKRLIERPLQVWRIHGENASRQYELSRPALGSLLSRYREYRRSPSAHAYDRIVHEFGMMQTVLEERRHLLPRGSDVRVDAIRRELRDVIEAYSMRAQLTRASRLRKLGLIGALLARGHYRRFKGVYSLAKDLFR
jgi:glycosyltransferase involved in cell wall biosynthesis